MIHKFPNRRVELKNKAVLMQAWVLVPLLFFSLSQSKLVLYILPIYPGLAIGAIYFWEKLSDSKQKLWEHIQLGFHLILAITLALLPFIDSNISLNYKFYFIWFITTSLILALQKVDIKRGDRTVISALVFTMGITGMASYFMSQNPKMANDTKNVTEWLMQTQPGLQEVIIYNKRLPSVLFNSDLKVISVYDGDESLNRETQFQEDDLWKESLINLKADPNWITNSAADKSIWISKEKSKLPELKDGRKWELLKVIDGCKIMRLSLL